MAIGALLTRELTRTEAWTEIDSLLDFWSRVPSAHYAQNPLRFLSSADDSRLFFSRSDAGQIVAMSIVTPGRSRLPGLNNLRITRGPMATDPEAFQQHLKQLLPQIMRSGHSLLVNPFVHGADGESHAVTLGALGFDVIEQTHYADTIITQVSESYEEQWRNLRRSTRTAINRARRAGVEIRLLHDAESYRLFAEKIGELAKLRGFEPLPAAEADLLAKLNTMTGGEHSYLLSAARNGRRIGEVLLLRNPQSLVYEWGWISEPEYRDKLPVMHGLMFEALKLCRQKGLSELDMGGYWRDRGGEDPINQFKLGFSKQIRHYLPEQELVLSRVPYMAHRWIRALTKIVR